MTTRLKKIAPNQFINLHNHSHYSVLDGLTKIKPLIEKAKSYQLSAVALTDHGTMSGAIELYMTAHEYAIKPIIGIEAYIAERSHLDKDPLYDKQYYHLTILAQNNQGYLNLMRLSSIANLAGFYYRPRIDLELLKKYNEGLIVLSGCIGSQIGSLLRDQQYDLARSIAQKYLAVFGDRYYIEVQDHGHPDHPHKWTEQELVNQQLLKLANELNIPAVVTTDSHYLNHDDQKAHEILLCVQTGSFLDETDRLSLANFDLSFPDPSEVIARWEKVDPNLVLNSLKIADSIEVNIELDKILIPKFKSDSQKTEDQLLNDLVYSGLAWRYLGYTKDKALKLAINKIKTELPAQVLERAEYELSVITKMGFKGYFLIIQDFINWGKDRGIVFGPGRGSAAGSIIAYALNITTIDPLKYDLLFERFLNPDRISMPDIDIDIMDSRRQEVIDYCANKYGQDQVANIVTFGTMAARNAIRDTARVLRVPYAEADRLAKLVPPPVQGHHIPLIQSIDTDKDLREEYQNNPRSKEVIDLAIRLEGTIRSHGVHAAGVIIAPEELVKYAPLEMAQKGVVATQYAMGPVEAIGLLKMDFLGLANLTIIKNALRIISKVFKTDINIDNIPLDDQLTYELLASGQTIGVFQLESAGMQRYLKKLQPTEFEDVIAMVALYRPGPMQFIDSFINNKQSNGNFEYFHPAMENALKSTYGVLIYQEQVMQISKEVCGFSGAEADTLRKAIGKKKIDIMAKMKLRMIEGGYQVSAIPKKRMELFWQQLEDFAAYCFNKSHAACYGLIAYQTAYLKAHYPSALMSALMTSHFNDTERLAIDIKECQRLGIEVLPPDINQSFAEFAVILNGQEQAIRFSLQAIKNVGTNTVKAIVEERSLNGPYVSLEDFLSRIENNLLNRKSFEALIKTGAFDQFYARELLLENLDLLQAYQNKLKKDKVTNQTDLFANGDTVQTSTKLKLVVGRQSYKTTNYLKWERDLLGLYISDHPLNKYGQAIRQLTSLNKLANQPKDIVVEVGGIINSLREIVTKSGSKMAFVQIEDLSATAEVIVFPRLYKDYADLIKVDSVLKVTAKLSSKASDEADIKLLAEKLEALQQDQTNANNVVVNQEFSSPTFPGPGAVSLRSLAQNASANQPDDYETKLKSAKFYVRLIDEAPDKLIKLKRLVIDNAGRHEVILVTGQAQRKQAIRIPYKIEASQNVTEKLIDWFGAENVVLK